jgi:hypothetical protein
MAVMRVDHRDIVKFLSAKTVDRRFPNFNDSVPLTDDFMSAATRHLAFDSVIVSDTSPEQNDSSLFVFMDRKH